MNKDFILRELTKVTKIVVKGDNAIIHCPFHDQHNPLGTCSISLGLKTKAGVWHCWSCNASGPWNALATKLGLRTTEDEVSEINYYVKNVKIPILEDIDEDKLVLKELPVGFKWKRYTKEFLDKFDAKLLWHEKVKEYYLYFPMTYMQDYIGYIRAKLDKSLDGPKYWFSFKTKLPYPVDYLMDKDTSSVVLVEGISDALRLLKNDIPALALLGVSLTKQMKDILEAMGVESVVLCLDGDDAGRKAAFKLASELHKLKLETRVIVPPDEKDPDTMPFRYVKVVKHLIKKLQR